MNIPIVDEQDRIINETIGEDIDDDIEGIYRVSCVWIISGTGEVFLSRRALNKKRSPGLWSPAVVGIVEKEETYESSARKWAKMLLGVELGDIIEVPKIFVQTDRKYFVQFFVAVFPVDFHKFVLNKDQIVETRWYPKGDLEFALSETPDIFIPLLRESYGILREY